MKRICLLGLLLAICLISMLAVGRVPQGRTVSLIQVIANPEAFDGQRILVVGYLKLEFEGSELYVHKDDADQHLMMNGVRVRSSSKMAGEKDKINEHYIVLVGVFRAAPPNSLIPSIGILDDITEFRLWP